MPIRKDDFAKSPISALRFISRHCSVPSVRFIPRDSQALISNFLRNRLNHGILRGHQKNEPEENARARRILRVAKPDVETAPHAAMRCSSTRSGAHNLPSAARLTSRCALPDSMMLASFIRFLHRARAETRYRSNSPRAFPVRPANARHGAKGCQTAIQAIFWVYLGD